MHLWPAVSNVTIDRQLPAEDPTCLWPKLSARVPDDLHQRVRIEAIRRHLTVQAVVIAALEAWLAAS